MIAVIHQKSHPAASSSQFLVDDDVATRQIRPPPRAAGRTRTPRSQHPARVARVHRLPAKQPSMRSAPAQGQGGPLFDDRCAGGCTSRLVENRQDSANTPSIGSAQPNSPASSSTIGPQDPALHLKHPATASTRFHTHYLWHDRDQLARAIRPAATRIGRWRTQGRAAVTLIRFAVIQRRRVHLTKACPRAATGTFGLGHGQRVDPVRRGSRYKRMSGPPAQTGEGILSIITSGQTSCTAGARSDFAPAQWMVSVTSSPYPLTMPSPPDRSAFGAVRSHAYGSHIVAHLQVLYSAFIGQRTEQSPHTWQIQPPAGSNLRL